MINLSTEDYLKSLIAEIPDFPEPGINFKDITPLLANGEAFDNVISLIYSSYKDAGITKVAAMEARGFIFGPAVACKLGAGFVPFRKPGKLPREQDKESYGLEYGKDVLCVHSDSFKPYDRVLIVDDVLATGGTAGAAAKLVEYQKADVAGFMFLIELEFLGGREKIKDYRIESLIKY